MDGRAGEGLVEGGRGPAAWGQWDARPRMPGSGCGAERTEVLAGTEKAAKAGGAVRHSSGSLKNRRGHRVNEDRDRPLWHLTLDAPSHACLHERFCSADLVL